MRQFYSFCSSMGVKFELESDPPSISENILNLLKLKIVFIIQSEELSFVLTSLFLLDNSTLDFIRPPVMFHTL